MNQPMKERTNEQTNQTKPNQNQPIIVPNDVTESEAHSGRD